MISDIFSVIYSLEWRTELRPRIVLDLLEKRQYKVVAMTGIGQTCIWTCHIPSEDGTINATQQSPGGDTVIMNNH